MNKISITITSFVVLVIASLGPVSVFAATSPTLSGSSSYSVLGGSTVTNTGSTTTSGAVGVSAGTAITGFPPGVAGGGTHSNDASAIAAQTDNLAAFTTLDQGCDHSYSDGQDLTLLSPLGPGVYCSAGSFALSGNLTLTGSGVWIFKSASTLIAATNSSVTGGDPCNVWWRVGSSATLGTTSSLIGNIFALASITFNTGATLGGRALAQNGAVTLDTNTISGPTCSVPPAPVPVLGLRKIVSNTGGGTALNTDWTLSATGTGGSPTNLIGTTPVDSTGSFQADTYALAENNGPAGYTTGTYSCVKNGGAPIVSNSITLVNGDTATCTVTNNYIVPTTTSGGGGGYGAINPVAPLIDVVKVPSPLSLPNGSGLVTYTYTVSNIGTVSMNTITMIDDSCGPLNYISGDIYHDLRLDPTETWTYTCSTTLSSTHTNTVVARGWAYGASATDVASATVVVGAPISPPLIHVTKVPSPLALSVGGGAVTYTEKVTNPGVVALSNVMLADDKCSPVAYISGDINGDAKLDVNETWTYTCLQNLTQTTTNTVTATGQANGITATDFAIVTVMVAVPSFPNTGLPDASGFGQRVRTIAIDLRQGRSGNNIILLQQFLISQDKGLSAKALARHGTTTYFGLLTRAALAEFQASVGIDPALGNFGPITRAYLAVNY